jgi:predicted nucleic acid-binding protein
VATPVVIHAPCVVDVLLNGVRAAEVLEAIYGRSLVAPVHIDVDVASALALMQQSGVPAGDIRVRLEIYLRIPLKRFEVAPLMLEAWDRQGGLYVRDGLYVALAEHLGVPLVTRDRRLADTCSRAILVQATRGWGALRSGA